MSPEASGGISLTVNGERRALDGDLSVAGLLQRLPVPTPRVAVLLNGDVVRGEDHPRTTLCDGDTVEIISMVGGG